MVCKKKKINGCLIGVSVFKYCTVITEGDIIQNLKYVFDVNNYTPPAFFFTDDCHLCKA